MDCDALGVCYCFSVRLWQMEPSSQSQVTGGLWNNPRPPQYSKGTQDMLKSEMKLLLVIVKSEWDQYIGEIINIHAGILSTVTVVTAVV